MFGNAWVTGIGKCTLCLRIRGIKYLICLGIIRIYTFISFLVFQNAKDYREMHIMLENMGDYRIREMNLMFGNAGLQE